MKIRMNNNKTTNNMKRTMLSFAILATMAFSTMSANAQGNGFDGFFGSENPGGDYGNGPEMPILPYHNLGSNQEAAPLGSGLVVLGALGAGYALLRRKED